MQMSNWGGICRIYGRKSCLTTTRHRRRKKSYTERIKFSNFFLMYYTVVALKSIAMLLITYNWCKCWDCDCVKFKRKK